LLKRRIEKDIEKVIFSKILFSCAALNRVVQAKIQK